ncbi:MAG TPA: methionine gamma-lyase family protein [Clostridiaceae bacterium]|nr:methionine gamma-lyase family protein [Clostridiaceae bacterium]
MHSKSVAFLKKEYGISDKVIELHEKALEEVAGVFAYYDEIRELNQFKVLKAFQAEKVSDYHFTNSTGYGYGDIGRDTLDVLYARVFKAEAALVRPHFVSGTHAIAAALYGVLRPRDTMLTICGKPYDTLHSIIGLTDDDDTGSLKDYGILYREVALKDDKIDIQTVLDILENDPTVKMVHIQRSTGYGWRKSLTIDEIEAAVREIRTVRQDVVVFVDNCYGEFVEDREPIEVGADLIAGSLIKNIGGGIAQTGGYVVGRKDLVEKAAFRLTLPGIGGEAGSTFGVMRSFYQGLFLAPHITMEAVKTSVYAAKLLELAGFEVLPKAEDIRTDIIQAIRFGDKDKMISFVKGIQYGAPVDSSAVCEPWDMPGYEDQVIMAAGAFIQGASIELSCDAPIREPYIAYLQGGLTLDHGKLGVLIGLSGVFIS